MKGHTTMTERQKLYRASSILRDFIDRNDVKVDWYALMFYDEIVGWNPFRVDDHLDEEYWSDLIEGYLRLDERERWKARHYASEFFTDFHVEKLKAVIEKRFISPLVIEEVAVPIQFKNGKDGNEPTPHLFVSDGNNTIFLKDDGLFCDVCGHLNFNNGVPTQGIPDLRSELRKYMRRIRRSKSR
jgi:hypothetical protein